MYADISSLAMSADISFLVMDVYLSSNVMCALIPFIVMYADGTQSCVYDIITIQFQIMHIAVWANGKTAN